MAKNVLDVINVKLEDSNLIEASAGTGKTYSVAILVLRLILEKNIPVESILMVTFTNAAVAEMEIRIRNFIRKAYHFVVSGQCDDETIQTIVQRTIDVSGIEETEKTLKKALLFLDETAIYTIHGFCQKTLTEYAFETDQIFGSEILTSQNDMIEDAVNEFWRKKIALLEPDLLTLLIENHLSRTSLTNVILESLNGKKFIADTLDNNHPEQVLFEKQKELQDEYEQCVIAARQNINVLKEKVDKNRYARDLYNSANGNPETLTDLIIEKFESNNPAYLKKYFEDLYIAIETYETIKNDYLALIKQLTNSYLIQGLEFAIKQINSKKKKKNYLSFNDLIQQLHKAVIKKSNKRFHDVLNEKYKAVFIDEFQDTDRLQYEIFHSVFHTRATMFYIGDPKQSIYSWRKADLHTYKKARAEVNHIYTMDKNFRSTKNFIKAINQFFLPKNDFDTFNDDTIRYETVKAGLEKAEMTAENNPVHPILIHKGKKNDEITAITAKLVESLLTEKYNINGREITPSDIGILVKTNKQGKSIKAELDKKNIPAVMIDDIKVLQTREALSVFYLITAVHDPLLRNIKRALFSPFTHYSIDDIQKLDEEKQMQYFREFKDIWLKKGIYSMISKFISIYQVKNKLLAVGSKSGERTLTNLYQITEILHKKEMNGRLSPENLCTWLLKSYQDETDGENEYLQRMESDEDAVIISTIHKSKGLSYNIVIAPFLDFQENKKNTYKTFREDDGTFVFTETLTEDQKAKYDQQIEQENRRLIYVTLTRAVYQCYIISNEFYKTSPLRVFLNEIVENELIHYADEIDSKKTIPYRKHLEKINFTPQKVSVPEMDTTWQVSSFSAISDSHESVSEKEVPVFDNEYDQFIFEQVPRGTAAGNFLHALLESVDFTNQEIWEETVQKIGSKYSSVYNPELQDFYLQMINHIVSAHIQTDHETFCLNKVSQKLPELEFYFKANRFNTKNLSDISKDVHIDNTYDIEGVLHGFIDLFFELGGKYYILDWKSNFLGNRIEDYQTKSLQKAMLVNNYHLQYLIYSVAAKRFLEKRLTSFDYNTQFGGIIYVFLRGTRINQTHGIFYHKTEMSTVEKIENLFSHQ